MKFLEIKNLKQKYLAGVTGVHRFSLECEKEEIVAIFARECGGKTSLLKAVAGLLPIEEGEIIIKGNKVNDVKLKDRNIAMIYEDGGLIEAKSVEWNLFYPLKLRKCDKNIIKEKVNAVAKEFKLDFLLSYRASRLTANDKVRLMFARASLREADLFLIDNPFNLIKESERRDIFVEMNPYIRAFKGVVLFATDNLDEARTLTEKIAILRYGVTEQIDYFNEIKKNPATIEVYKYFNGNSANIEATQLYEKDNSLAVNILGEEVILSVNSDELINPIYIGSKIKVAYKTKQAKKGIEASPKLIEYFKEKIYAHTTLNGQSIITELENREKGKIFISVDIESIRLYDDSNEKLILKK